MSRRALLRLIDANTNRALEGTRVCEEIVRFSVGDVRAWRRLRRLRHAIAQAVESLPVDLRQRLTARNSVGDMGRRARGERVASAEQLLVQNLQRVKEALRVLEECGRLLAPHRAAEFQRLRFRVYEVERVLLLGVAPVRHR